MSLSVTLTPGDLGLGYCWPGPQQYLIDICAAILAQVPGIFNGVNFGPNTPAPIDQDKPWIKTDSYGRIIRVYAFSGAWLAPHPVQAGSSAIPLLWKGTESDLWSYDEGGGADPGNAGNPSAVSDTTGPFWIVDHDFDYRIPIGPGENSVAYSGAKTTIAVGGTAGEEKHSLSALEMDHNHLPFPGEVQTGAGSYPAVAILPGAILGAGILPHNNMPPVRAIYFCKRSARKYYVA